MDTDVKTELKKGTLAEKVTRYPLCTIKETCMEIEGTENLHKLPYEESVPILIKILKELSFVTQIILEVGKPLIVRRVEITNKELNVDVRDSQLTDPIVNTLFRADIFSP